MGDTWNRRSYTSIHHLLSLSIHVYICVLSRPVSSRRLHTLTFLSNVSPAVLVSTRNDCDAELLNLIDKGSYKFVFGANRKNNAAA